MTHSGKKTEPRRIESTGRHRALALLDDNLCLVDDRAFREQGYNPYNTIAHARETRRGDVWRNKPKRA
jgi:hypothetical protein